MAWLEDDGTHEAVEQQHGPVDHLRQCDRNRGRVGAFEYERPEPVVDRYEQPQRLVLTLQLLRRCSQAVAGCSCRLARPGALDGLCRGATRCYDVASRTSALSSMTSPGAEDSTAPRSLPPDLTRSMSSRAIARPVSFADSRAVHIRSSSASGSITPG